MFPKSERLRNNEEINKTLKKGVNLKTPFFNVKYFKTNDDFKITVVVSKKISKKAVSRNRLKRIVREAIQKVIKNEKLNLRGNFVFFPFENALEKKSTDLEFYVKKIFEKIL